MASKTPQKRVLFTRSPRSIWATLFVALVFSFVFFTRPAAAVANPTINFQARLMTSSGAIAADGSYSVAFNLYSAASGGTALWTETQTLSVANGYLTANLGSVNAFANATTPIPWGSPLWLTMNVNSDGEMAPRLSLTAVPTALALTSSNATGFVSTLSFTAPTANETIVLPAESSSSETVCYWSDVNCGFAASSGSSSYIHNQTGAQTNANFDIQGSSSTVTGVLEANGGDILDLQNSSAVPVVSFSGTGVITVAGAQSADITTANAASSVANGITIRPGTSGGAASNGGTTTIQAGTASGTGTGGLLTLQGGTSGSGTAAAGGQVLIQGGTASGTGTSNGGNIVLQGGTASGTGTEGQIQINGPLLYATTAYSSGSSSTITLGEINSNTTILATATASGLTFTVPSPSITTAGRILQVSNVGTNAFVLAGGGTSFTLNAGSTATLMWNGTAWTNAGVDASTLQTGYTNSVGGTTPSIKLDSTRGGISIQDADSSLGGGVNFLSFLSSNAGAGGLGTEVFGFGINGTYFQKPKTDGLDFEIQQNNGGVISTTKDVFSVDTTPAASVVNLGSTASSGYNGSTVNIVTTNNANGTVNIGSSTLAGSATQTINVGYSATNTGTTNINIGTASPGAGTTTVRGAGGLTLTGGAASTWSTTAGALTIQGFAGVTLQTPGTAVTSTNSSAVTIQTGNATGTTSNSGSISIDVGTATGTTGSLNLGNTNASTVNVGNESGASGGTVKILGNSIAIGNSGAVSRTVNIASSANSGITQTVNIANNTTAGGKSVVLIGSLIGTSTTTIQGGTSGTAIALTTGANGAIALSTSAGTGSVSVTSSNLSGTFSSNTFTLKSTTTNQSNAFLIQNTSGYQAFTINTVAAGTSTSNEQITLGNVTAGAGQGIAGQITFADGSNDNFDVTLTGNGSGNDSAYYTAYQSIVIPNLSGIMAVVQSTAGSAQTGYINVNGGLYTPLLDTASAGTLTIGGANANAVAIGNTTAATTTTIEGGTGSSAVSLQTGTGGTIQVGNTTGAITQNVKIGTNATAGSTNNVTVGSTVSGGTDVVQAGTTSETITNAGDTIQASSSATAYVIQNASANYVLGVSTITVNIITNSGFDANVTNWAAKSTSAVSQDTSAGTAYSGIGALKAVVTAATSGAQTSTFTTPILASTQYQLTFYAKCSASITTFTYGHQDVSGTDINATTSGACNTGWQQYTAHYTTGSSLTTPNIYVDSGTTASVSIWIDDVSLVQTTTSGATNYQPGTIYLNGVVGGPVVLQGSSNSTTAFQIQNSASTDVFDADTTDGWIGIGTSVPTNRLTVAWLSGDTVPTSAFGSSNASDNQTALQATSYSGTAIIGTSTSATGVYGISTSGNALVGTSTSGLGVFGSSALSSSGVFSSSASGNTNATLVAVQNASSSATLLEAATSTYVPLFVVTGTGTAYLQNSTNSPTAFQIINTASATVLNYDTTVDQLTTSGGTLVVNAVANPATPALTTATSGGSLPANSYYYEIEALGANGGVSMAIPSTPAFKTTTGSASKNTLNWTAVPYATGYTVYRSNNGSTWFQYTGSITSGTTTLADTTNSSWSGTVGSPNNNNSTGGVQLQTGTSLTLDGGAAGAGQALEFYNPLSSSIVIGNYNTGGNLDIQTQGLDVQDTTDYDNIFTISNTGVAVFQNASNSAAAFTVETAGLTPVSLLAVNTSNDLVQIGSATANSTPTLLVVNNYNTAADPTGVNGAMYYNSSLGRFRCYQNSIWANCISGVVYANTSVPAGNAVTATAMTKFTSSYTIPANDCQVGRVYTITAQGVYSTGVSNDSAMSVYWGSTAVLISPGGAPTAVGAASNIGWRLEAQITCVSTTAVEAQGLLTWINSSSGVGAYIEQMDNTGTITVTTGSSQNLQLAGEFSTTGGSMVLRQYIVNVSGP